MVWRGGARFARCLRSIEQASGYFSRVVISVTGDERGSDMELARQAQERNPELEVICTGTELPTMQHQAFWVDYLIRSGARPDDWVCWLSYDDELFLPGIEEITSETGDWPLTAGTAYFGPWAMRGEDPDALWDGDPDATLEAWTSFPIQGPTRLPAARWISDQLSQPTYMQMSGSVNPLRSFIELRTKRPRKKGPMRIEMATASVPAVSMVEEFSEPISIIYARSDSDRASYGRSARREDRHLAIWLLRYASRHPDAAPTIIRALLGTLVRGEPLTEDWRVRSTVSP